MSLEFTHTRLKKPCKDTHQWPPYRALWDKYGDPDAAFDPFARDCRWCSPWTNDISPDTGAEYNMDAEEFLTLIEDRRGLESMQVGLLDPPFSDRMSSDRYGTGNLYASDSGKITRIQKKMGNLIKPGGILIKAGYNTSKPHPSFELEEIVLVTMGPVQADVIFSIWRKTIPNIERWQ